MKKSMILWFLAGWLGMMACESSDSGASAEADQAEAPAEESEEKAVPDSVYVSRGKALAKASFQALRGHLMAAMQSGGVPKAIEVCAGKAAVLLDSLSNAHGARITRVSHKPRNPANAADSFEADLIARYEADRKAGLDWKPVIHRTAEGVTFYAPIPIKFEACLKCHGEPGKDIREEDYILIQQFYPQDQAIGFRMGDVRGLWKITFSEGS